MTLPVQNGTANSPPDRTVSNRKKELLNEARAEALRANLKKRKEQSSARRIEIKTTEEETTKI